MKPDIRPDIKKGRISGQPDIRYNPIHDTDPGYVIPDLHLNDLNPHTWAQKPSVCIVTFPWLPCRVSVSYFIFSGRGRKRKNSGSDDEDYSSNYYKPATNGNSSQVSFFLLLFIIFLLISPRTFLKFPRGKKNIIFRIFGLFAVHLLTIKFTFILFLKSNKYRTVVEMKT